MFGYTASGWIPIFLAAIGIIAGMALKRRQDLKWIKKRFGRELVVTSSFGVYFFGRQSDPGPPRPIKGVLLLTPDRLFYGRPRTGMEVDIPGDRIMRVSHGVRHKNTNLRQSVIKVDFLNSRDQVDTVAFKVPYPPQWIQAIGTTFGLRKTDADGKRADRNVDSENDRR